MSYARERYIRKWGIFWLVSLAVNAAYFGWDASSGRPGLAVGAAIAALFSGSLAFTHLTGRYARAT